MCKNQDTELDFRVDEVADGKTTRTLKDWLF